MEAATAERPAAPEGGQQRQLTFDVGGKRPTTQGLRLVGGRIEIDETFKKDEKAVLRVEIEVNEIAFVNQRDPQTGEVVGCERRQKARIVGVERVD